MRPRHRRRRGQSSTASRWTLLREPILRVADALKLLLLDQLGDAGGERASRLLAAVPEALGGDRLVERDAVLVELGGEIRREVERLLIGVHQVIATVARGEGHAVALAADRVAVAHVGEHLVDKDVAEGRQRPRASLLDVLD